MPHKLEAAWPHAAFGVSYQWLVAHSLGDGLLEDSPVGKTTRWEPDSATAWLAHIDILPHLTSSDLETALIFEDDADWDLRIKDQIRLVSDNVRAFGRSYDKTGHQLISYLDDSTPYGTGWDVLWVRPSGSLGHNLNAANGEAFDVSLHE
ncbi:uncharacterized protein B0I36DRAFT_356253 [Microdochium trichocladiopsis]|uniref:Uncharacterized protein n=1 Tax=Microdochium trichocladiopsis TaxID=1682393 RepID=A0A9P8XTQ8_9PEZI|nr:uncharacterized protein B0I36DRAFT_356253 [Microdochium trichocladiopsis]KAH7012164.1 hypothetical protein B0I36DRAFT_356253 [Microdochium trichocladiopsis]